MKSIALVPFLSLLMLSNFTLAQPCASDAVLMEQLSGAINREVAIDPRVCSLDGITVSDDIDYDRLLAKLRVENLTFETPEQLLFMPGNLRVIPTRLVQEDDPTVSDQDIVARVIQIPSDIGQSVPASRLVPILRPMMSIDAELSANRDTNTLILIDRYDSIRRFTTVIEQIIESAQLAAAWSQSGPSHSGEEFWDRFLPTFFP